MNFRIGHGYDIHRIVADRPLVLDEPHATEARIAEEPTQCCLQQHVVDDDTFLRI